MACPSIVRLRRERAFGNVVVMPDTPRRTTPRPRLSAHWRLGTDRRLTLTWTIILITLSEEAELSAAA
jgi:hypothetical protein